MRSAGLLFTCVNARAISTVYMVYMYVSTVLVVRSFVYMYWYLNQWAYNCLCMVIGFDVNDGSLGSGLLLGN